MVKKMYGVRTKRYKLIHVYDDIDEWELYDLEKDPSELTNLINDTKYSDVKMILHKKLETLLPIYSSTASKFMPVLGMNVHYRIEGNTSDTVPLVLIHGTSASLHTWDSLTLLLSGKKKIIRFDLPAFGLTGPNKENTYNADVYSVFVDSVLEKLNVKSCIIAGNSLGGSIAWHYALYNPSRVQQLILLDASGYPTKNEKGSLGFKIASMPVINNLLLWVTPKFLIKKRVGKVS
mgnify:CR=1 FL=1